MGPGCFVFKLCCLCCLLAAEFLHLHIAVVWCAFTNNQSWFGEDNCAVIWNILRDHTVGADPYVVSNADCTDNFCAAADVNIIADHRCAVPFAASKCIAANGDLMKDDTSLPNFCAGRDKNTVYSMGKDGLAFDFCMQWNVCIMTLYQLCITILIPKTN